MDRASLRDIGPPAQPTRTTTTTRATKMTTPTRGRCRRERSGINAENLDVGRNRDKNRDRTARASPGGGDMRELLRAAECRASCPARAPPRFSFFSGGGHAFGSDDIPSTFVPRRLTFWRDGFTIENEPLLRAINAGLAPPALLALAPGQPVYMLVARRTAKISQQAPQAHSPSSQYPTPTPLLPSQKPASSTNTFILLPIPHPDDTIFDTVFVTRHGKPGAVLTTDLEANKFHKYIGSSFQYPIRTLPSLSQSQQVPQVHWILIPIPHPDATIFDTKPTSSTGTFILLPIPHPLIMRNDEHVYLKLMFGITGKYATWDPESEVKAGDYRKFTRGPRGFAFWRKNGTFVREGNIYADGKAEKFGVPAAVEYGRDSEGEAWVTSSHATQTDASLSAGGFAQCKAKAAFKFSSGRGAVLAMESPMITTIDPPGALKQLLEDPSMRGMVVVSEVHSCSSYARLLSTNKSGNLTLGLQVEPPV
ncbi:hypothetical protein K438DRAFT_1999092 [Mycena galopus ATCC 62051]|nr:hypothetical protein K438DRAFT_1999092 [Mycena galopus ATCC 62051]